MIDPFRKRLGISMACPRKAAAAGFEEGHSREVCPCIRYKGGLA